MHDPRDPHFTALKRILRYVRGTLDYGLQLHVSSTTQLSAYTDADWVGCPVTRRSTSGYCVFLGDNLLSWSAKRQVTLYRFSAEAEYRGVANVVAETAWICNLLCELHTPLFTATLVYCDNVSAVYMSANPVQHQRTKHIEIDIHFVCDFVASGQVRVLHEIGFQCDKTQGECRSKFACHLDCFAWVKRDSYLPQGSHSLKAVTKAKLGYDPLEVNPEDMVRFAMEKPQELIENLNRDLLYAIRVEGKMDFESVSNYDEMKNDIMEKLIMLQDEPTREDCPLIIHLDVVAMYPNIILTNRLQGLCLKFHGIKYRYTQKALSLRKHLKNKNDEDAKVDLCCVEGRIQVCVDYHKMNDATENRIVYKIYHVSLDKGGAGNLDEV
ncbi:ribonuclease H-like domain-containing protein [Tanacetum coccineum]